VAQITFQKVNELRLKSPHETKRAGFLFVSIPYQKKYIGDFFCKQKTPAQ
jgi:hypothetical protein